MIAFEGKGRWIEYAGGYSDMVAQRGLGVGALQHDKPATTSVAPPAAPAQRATEPRKRLSPTEQHALKTSPARIAALNDEVRRLEHVIADPDFYAHDRTAFAAAGAELAKAQDDLTAAEEDWLRLELLREDRGE